MILFLFFYFFGPLLLTHAFSVSFIPSTVSLPGAGTLQQVNVPIISQSSCQAMYNTNPSEPVDIMSDMMCAGFQEGGKDSCQVGERKLIQCLWLIGWGYRCFVLV